jgi:hypothetical protein
MNKFWQQWKYETYCWWKGICPIHGEIDRNGPNWTKDLNLACPKCLAAASLPMRLDNVLKILYALRLALIIFGGLFEATIISIFLYWFFTHQDKVDYIWKWMWAK